MEDAMSQITTLTISQELNEKKLATLNNATVKEALNSYYGELQTIGKATWQAYKSFAVAYANMGKEKVIGKDGKEVERFKTKGQFYDFVGVNDSTGSLMLRAVAFNEKCLIDGKRLEEYGFTAGKVDMLSRVDEDMVTFLSYCKSCKYGSLEELAGISDKSLRAIIKQWEDAGRPAKYVPMKEAKTKEAKTEETKQETKEAKTEETKQETKQETEETMQETEETMQETEETMQETEETKTEVEVTREAILEMSLHYTGIDKDNILSFVKWLKAEMLKAVK